MRLVIYYDGKCVICNKEIEYYKKRDTQNKIEYIDIMSQDFDRNSVPIDFTTLNKYFHIKTKNNQFLTGVPAFKEIWLELGIWKPLQLLTNIYIFRKLTELGYELFVIIRPYLPRRDNCDTNYCQNKANQ